MCLFHTCFFLNATLLFVVRCVWLCSDVWSVSLTTLPSLSHTLWHTHSNTLAQILWSFVRGRCADEVNATRKQKERKTNGWECSPQLFCAERPQTDPSIPLFFSVSLFPPSMAGGNRSEQIVVLWSAHKRAWMKVDSSSDTSEFGLEGLGECLAAASHLCDPAFVKLCYCGDLFLLLLCPFNLFIRSLCVCLCICVCRCAFISTSNKAHIHQILKKIHNTAETYSCHEYSICSGSRMFSMKAAGFFSSGGGPVHPADVISFFFEQNNYRYYKVARFDLRAQKYFFNRENKKRVREINKPHFFLLISIIII